MEVALVIDDRTEKLADKDQAADGWREWLRISNALNLREQPTIITALTEASGQGRGGPREATGPFRIWMLNFRPSGRPAHDLAASGAERIFIEELARHARRGGEDDRWPACPSWGTRRRTAYRSTSPGRTRR